MVFIIFLITLTLSNLILPALLGPKELLIIPILLLAIVIFDKDFKIGLIKGLSFGLLVEIFSGNSIGNIILPLLLTIIIYYQLERFTKIRSLLSEQINTLNIVWSSIFLSGLTYLYSLFFILNQSSYNILLSWQRWNLLLSLFIILNTFFFAILFSLILKYIYYHVSTKKRL